MSSSISAKSEKMTLLQLTIVVFICILIVFLFLGNKYRLSWYSDAYIANVLWVNLTAYAPAFAVAFVAQAIFPAVKRPMKILTYEFWVDIMHVLFNSISYLTVFGLGAYITQRFMIESTPDISTWADDIPYILQSALAVWMFDFLVYWRHRFSHEISLLWPVHAIHHLSRKVDVLTTHRLHFLEVLAGGVIVGWAASSCRLNSGAVALGFIIYLQYNHFIHSNIRVKFTGPLKFLLVSPFMHRWHHALIESAHGHNYAVVFAFHDWLFRTALHPNHEPSEFGVSFTESEHVGESYIRQQIYPFRIWIQKLLAWFARR